MWLWRRACGSSFRRAYSVQALGVHNVFQALGMHNTVQAVDEKSNAPA
jgi:hypothetical protein